MTSIIREHDRSDYFGRTLEQTLTDPGSTDWVALSGQVAVQATGTATSFTGVVERSARDPLDGADPAPAGDAPLSGDISAGLPPELYAEPGVGWWRVRVTTLQGGTATVAISGRGC